APSGGAGGERRRAAGAVAGAALPRARHRPRRRRAALHRHGYGSRRRGEDGARARYGARPRALRLGGGRGRLPRRNDDRDRRRRLRAPLAGAPVTADVVVIGGGVIGCAVARELAQRGARTIVVERGRVGSEATGAAAGMVAPQAECEAPGPVLTLGLVSRDR